MDLSKFLDNLVPVLGQVGVAALKAELEELAGNTSGPWQKTLLALTADALQVYGPHGLQVAQEAIQQLVDGGEPPDIDWADLEVASDVLAHLQNAEADQKAAAKDFMIKVGKVLGQILSGLVKGLLA